MGATDQNDELANLLAACVQKERAAFGKLYEKTSAKLFGVQLRILKNRAVAEESLQEAYIKIWNNVERYQAQSGSPLVWMLRIARNQAIDTLRKQQRQEAGETGGEAWDSVLALTSGGTQANSAESELLAICLKRIREEFRICIVKIYCEGYTQEELSKKINIPLGTIKSWVRRGTQWLKGCYDELS